MAFVIYAAAAVLLFGRPLLEGGQHCLCVSGTKDEGIFVWAFEWWPHAIAHGLNPFYTHLVYAPQGFDLAHGTTVPGPALILAPVTAIAGPLFAFNLAMLLSPVLAAFFAFLLCRHVTGSFWPAVAGGWLFGFSTYMLGQLVGHLHLTLVFLVPAIVHLVLLRFAGEISPRRFVVLLVLALVLQASISLEVLASLTLFGVATLCAVYFTSGADVRARLARVAPLIGVAYAATVVLVSPYLYYALQPGEVPVVSFSADKYATDLAGLAIPTQVTFLGGLSFPAIVNAFTTNLAERSAYLGVPLIAMIVLAVRAGWRERGTRIMVVTLLAILLCSLGAHLHVAGARTLPLPWAIVDRLPVIGLMLPARFMVYCDLAAALLATTWLSRTHHRRSAWVLVLLSIAFLAPAVRRGYWNSVPPVPRLFRSSAYRRTFRARDIVLVLPMGFAGQSMLWQADAHLGFRMAGGYIVPPTAPDPYKKYAIYPTLTGGTPVADKDAAAARFIAAEHITVAVLGATAASGSPWPRIFKRLGWRATTREGAVLFRPAPPRMRSAARVTIDNADPHSPHRRVLAGSRAFG